MRRHPDLPWAESSWKKGLAQVPQQPNGSEAAVRGCSPEVGEGDAVGRDLGAVLAAVVGNCGEVKPEVASEQPARCEGAEARGLVDSGHMAEGRPDAVDGCTKTQCDRSDGEGGAAVHHPTAAGVHDCAAQKTDMGGVGSTVGGVGRAKNWDGNV